MGIVRPPSPVKLFAGILTSIPAYLPRVQQQLAEWLGPIDLTSEQHAFDMTSYYTKQMGTPIVRCFVAFESLIPAEQIASIKLATNELENTFSAECRDVPRPVNIDPGYMEESKIVLASTKNFYHRILLANGIYGEVTMHYRDGHWEAFPWTFPDFRSGRYDRFFVELREKYRNQLKRYRLKPEANSG